MDLEVGIAKVNNPPAALEAMLRGGGLAALASSPGCRSAKVMPGVEQPDRLLFLVEWDSVEAHAAAKSSESFQKFVKIMSPYFAGEGSMQHFRAGE